MKGEIESYSDYAADALFQTEILVIGTGAGGGVVGAELAEAGIDVTFVEEGAYYRSEDFDPHLSRALPQLYRDAGATMIMGKAPIPYVEGRCVGGSTVINGAMTYRPPERVLSDWADMSACDELGPKGLDWALSRVESRIHAKAQNSESIGGDNRVMQEGSRRLGWRYTENRRNQEHCVGTNTCVTGCPTGAKQSTLVSYMPRALSQGARVLTEVRIESLIIEHGRCVGAKGRAIHPITRAKDKRVVIRAQAVVVAAGAVQTPNLLLKHRLGRPSRELGRNFLCHPNAKMFGIFPYEVQGWKGVSQAGQVKEMEDEGIVLGINFIPPGLVALGVEDIADEGWTTMQRYNHMVVGACLVEDSTSGRVRRSPFGSAFVRYDITPWDLKRFIRGSIAMAELWFEMGAEAVNMPFVGWPLISSMDALRAMDTRRLKERDLELFTVHLMGTARMGSRAQDSVVNLDGELWDLPGCYVADASVFPSAVGVNPQITIMAMATRIAARLPNQRRPIVAAA
mgnify:CR=1 FL=1